MIEDQDLGLIKEKEMPDVKAVAADLVGKGFSTEDAQSVVSKLGLSSRLNDELFSEMVALETAEAGNDPLPAPTGDVKAPVTSSTKTSAATNAKPLPQAENASQPPTGSVEPFDLGGYDDGFDLDGLGTTTVMADIRTALANVEIGTLATAYLGEEVAGDVDGEDNLYELAVQKMGEDIYRDALALGEQRIQEAQTPEEVEQAIADTEKAAKRDFIPIVEFKKNWVIQRSGVEQTDLPRLDQKVLEQHIIAGEIDKIAAKTWETASTTQVLGDVAELFVPVTGVLEEERIKFTNSVSDALDKIAEGGDVETQVAIANALAEDILNTETMLFSNNNALLNLGQAQALSDAIKQGGLARLNGQITDSEYENLVMSAVNTAFAGAEIAGLKGAFKWLAGRVFPQPKGNLKNLYKQLEQAKPLEGDLLIGGQDNLLPSPTRSAGSAKHVEYSENPTAALIDNTKEGGIKAQVEKHGLKAADAALNHMPTPSVSTDLGFADLIEDRQNLSSIIFADNSVMSAGEARALELEKSTGGDIRFIPSAVGFIEDTEQMEDSLGVFKLLFGRSGSKGFDTAEDATNAAKKNVLGDKYDIVTKDGKYYIEVEQRQWFDPVKDVKGTELESNIIMRALNPLRQLGDEFMKGVFAIKGTNRAKTVALEKRMTKALSGMTPNTANYLHEALVRGDNMMYEWRNYGTFLRDNGFRKNGNSKAAFRRYREVRDLMEEVYHIRNNAFFRKKNALGYKNIKLGDDVFELGRRVQKGDVDTRFVWDQRTNKMVNKADIPDDVVVMKIDNVVEREGKNYNHIIVEPDTVSNMPRLLLNKRKGHVDRMYRDTGYTIKLNKKVEIGGTKVGKTSTTHIFKTKKEADAEVAKLRAEDPEADYNVVAARENSDMDDIFNDTSSVQFSYGASHTKARKSQVLKGVDGMDAPLADITDRLRRAVSSAGRAYDVDIVDTMKARFTNGYEKVLAKGKATPWDNDFGRMTKGQRSWSDEVQAGAAAMHNYIKKFEQIENDMFLKAIDVGLEFLSGGRIVGKAQSANVAAQQLATNLYIVGAPLFQIPQNFVQLAYVHMRHPISGSVAVAQTPFVISSLLRKTPDYKFVGRALGVSPEIAEDVIKTLKSSGLLNVGSADDFLSMTRKTVTASSSSGMGILGEMAKNLATLKPARGASQVAQESSVALVNIAAYLAEFNKLVVRGGAKYNAKTKAQISFNAQKVTNTQNNIDKFWFQDKGNIASLALQFAQHMTKVFLDAVVEPTLTAATGKSLGKSKGALSESRARAFYSVTFVASMFGLTGMAGNKAGEFIGDAVRSEFPDVDETLAEVPLQGGFFNTLINSTLNYLTGMEGEGDFTGRMGPGGLADYVNDTFIANGGSLEMLGPFGGAASSIIDWGVSSYQLLSSDIEMDDREKVRIAAREALMLFKGFKDYDKARIAVAMEQWPYYSKLGSDLRVSELEGHLALFSITPMMVQDQMNDMEWGGAKSKDSIAKINEVLIREAKRELLSKNPERDYRKTQEIILKWQTYAYNFSGYSSREQVARLWADNVYNSSTDTYQEYIKTTINVTITVLR